MENPLEEILHESGGAEPCILVIFGATGDLTARKLVPALYDLAREGHLPAHFACVGVARRDKSDDDFRREMKEAISKYSRVKPIDEHLWDDFSQQLFYHRTNFDDDAGYDSLKSRLEILDKQFETRGNRVFYLSTQPSFFPTISENLSEHKLMYSMDDGKWSRVIIEKPFGHDLESAKELQSHIEKHLDERQIYRIDHYLGKETVQNLLVFRFSNPIFEDLWNSHHIDHVQITFAEDIGIGTRGLFWEEAGMLRDIVQNHLMQLLSLVAMEPPTNFDSSSIHDEKVKVLEAIRPIADRDFIRGQYKEGYLRGEKQIAYREENNVDPDSNVETFVAMKLMIDNWRWGEVPFYIRAGKALPKRSTEIAITFKKAPGALFQTNTENILVIRIQPPNEGISFKMNCKVPGLASPLQPVNMDFQYGDYFGITSPEPYERLICDCMAGDSTLFARSDEVMASWKLLTPLLKKWKNKAPGRFPNYNAGMWGPEEAERLMTRDGRSWRRL